MNRYLAAVCLSGALSASAQTIDISPAGPLLAGDDAAISVTGLAPKTKVQIVAERLIGGAPGRRLYRAEAVFVTDADGKVDLTRAAPSSGSYRGPDGRGLFWSMVPTSDAPPAGLEPDQVLLSARIDGNQLA